MSLNVAGITATTIYADATALTAFNYTTSTAFVGSTNWNGMFAQVTDLGVFQLSVGSTAAPDATTVIAATPKGNWLAVTNPPSLFLTDGNKIDESQLPTSINIVLNAGTALLPPLSTVGDLDTGLYFPAANSIGLTTNGVLRVTLNTANLTSTLPLALPAGTAAAPAVAIGGEQTGPYLAAAGSLGLAVAGAIKANLTATALNMATGVALQIATIQVVGARNTGWTTFAGTGTKNQSAINVDSFTATDANIRLLGQGVKGILDALILHGLLGA